MSNSWGTDKYAIEYDTEIFVVTNSTESTLNLVLEEDEQRADVYVNAVHPFTYSDEDGIEIYIDSAVKAFEQYFSRISNRSDDMQTQKGVTIKTLSISGDAVDIDGVSLGMMKLLVSDKTLMNIEVIGNAQIIKKHMDAILTLLESARLGE
ncbi:MAG TPA: hypothetical protein PLP35_03665 [Caldisericia bacterium]|nr:hypothetical protein [Caldisericia bacterium]